MTEKKIKVGPVGSYSLPVVIKREDGPIWERNTSNALPPAIVTIFVLIYVIPKMNHVIYRVLASYKAKVSILIMKS